MGVRLVDLREIGVCITGRELRSGLGDGTLIKKVFGIPPELLMTLLPGNSRLLMLESTRRLPLHTAVVSEKGEEFARESLDGGHTLALPLHSSKVLPSFILEASHFLHGPVMLLWFG